MSAEEQVAYICGIYGGRMLDGSMFVPDAKEGLKDSKMHMAGVWPRTLQHCWRMNE